MENIEKTLIRPEYKLKIYWKYLLPSIRFILTIHDLKKCHLEKLDSLCEPYIKSWLCIPKLGANTAFVHDKHGLNISTITDLYMECHTLAHSRTRTIGHVMVNHALKSKLARESKWTRQLSTTVVCKNTHEQGISEKPPSTSWKSTKAAVKKVLTDNKSSHWRSVIQSL